MLWDDPRYGMKSIKGLKFWIKTVEEGEDSDISRMLRDYFLLDYVQTSLIMWNIGSYVDNLNIDQTLFDLYGAH